MQVAILHFLFPILQSQHSRVKTLNDLGMFLFKDDVLDMFPFQLSPSHVDFGA